MGQVNKKLLPLKLLLFFLYAAIGCLPAFLTIHMSHIGLSHDEITWINTVLPITSIGGPPFVGYLADRFGHHRVITIVSMFLAGVFHTALLFVPERAPTHKPNLQMVCDLQGSSLVMESCLGHCPLVHGTLEGSFRISRCRQECEIEHKSCRAIYMPSSDNPNVSLSVDVSAEVSTEGISPPNICFHNNEMVDCEDFEFSTYSQIRTKLEPVLLEKRFSGFEECCEYPFAHFSTYSRAFSNMSCNSTQDCYVVCNVMEMTNGSWLLQEPVCSKDGSNPNLTFWLYFCIRAVADMFPAILISLFEAVVLTMVNQHGGDFGRQKMFGLFAIGTSAPLVGYLMDGGIGVYGKYVYAPVFYVFDVLLLLTAIITFLLPLKMEVQIKSMLRNLTELIRTSEFNMLVFIVIILGSLNGYLETFLYIHLAEKLNAPKLLLGLTITVGIVPSLPFLYKSDSIVNYCGHHYLLILAFVGYCVRFAGLSYLTNPLWVIPLEMLEIFTINLMQVTAATLTYRLAPKTLVATAQGLVWISHHGIGRALGTIVGGYLIKVYGMIRVFQGASVLSASCATLYLVLYQTLKYVKVNRPTKHGEQEGKENGTISNGNYMPLLVRERNC